MTLLKSTSVTEVNGKKEVMMKKNALLSIVATLSFAAALTLVPSCGKSHPEVFQNEPELDQLSDEESVRPDDEPFEVSADIQLNEDVVQSVIGEDGTKITYQISGSVLKAKWAVGDTIFGIFSSSSKVSYRVSRVDADGKAHFTKLDGSNPSNGTRVYMFYAPKKDYYNQLMGSKRTLTVDLRYQRFDDSQFSSGSGTYSGRLPTFMTSIATASANGIHFSFTHRTSVLGLYHNTFSNSGSSESVKQVIIECSGLQTAGTFTPSGDAINFADDSSTRGAIWLDCANLTAGEMSSRTLFFVLFNGGTSGQKMTMTARTSAARYYNVSKSAKSSFSTGNYYKMTEVSFYERWVIPSDCVDLGIRKAGQSTYYPPVYWRKANVGTTTIQDYGDYYQWGYPSEGYAILYSSLPSNRYTSGDNLTVSLRGDNGGRAYNWWRFPFGWSDDANGTNGQISRFNFNSALATNGGRVDNISELDAYNDVAYRVVESNYATPNRAAWEALKAQTYCVWTSNYNGTSRRGLVIYEAKRVADRGQWSKSSSAPSGLSYSTSNRHIFLPAAGWITNTNVMSNQILNAYYWTSTLETSTSYNAYGFKVESQDPGASAIGAVNRFAGLPVRPIYVPTSKSN